MTKQNRIRVNCAECGKILYRIKSRIERTERQFCDRKCLGAWQSKNTKGRNNSNYKGRIEYNCDYCGSVVIKEKYRLERSKNLFCNQECFNNWRRENWTGENSPAYKGGSVIVNCYVCGCEIEREPNQLKRNDKNFCGRECWAEWRRSDEWRGPNNPTYKPELSDEERTARSSIEPHYNTWIKYVRERDDFTCQVCGYRNENGRITVHHLDSWNSFPEKRVDMTNGICVCFDCHDEFHSAYGRGDNTKEQFIEFCQSKSVQLDHEHCRLFIS